MCGFAGILSLEGTAPDLPLATRMVRVLSHRGPDGEGAIETGPFAAAHVRLKIIDLSDAASQPFVTERGTVLVYNGEVFDWEERRAELEALGTRFRTRSDTEVVARAYEAWGDRFLERLNGQFALVIWDPREQRLLAARDRLGVKPLYYAFSRDERGARRLLFASEPPALLQGLGDPRIDLPVTRRFLERGLADLGGRTFLEGVHRLPPARLLVVRRDGRTALLRYWTIDAEAARAGRALGRRAAERELRELALDAVRLELRSDVPVGMCLSGGLDSSFVVAAATRCGVRPHTFSAFYRDRDLDERRYAELVARTTGATAQEIEPSWERYFDLLPTLAIRLGEPATTGAVYTQWHVFELAAPHVRVMLDGQGPDELFCGYTYLAPAAAAARLETGLLRDGPLALSDAWTTLAWGQRASGGALFRGAGSLLGSRLSRLPRPASRLLGPALLDVPPAQPDEHEREDLSRARALGDPLARRCAAEATVLHLPLLLRLEDRMSMAHSVEARVPFLDHRIVELASGLRPEIRVRGPWTKAVLRDAARGLVPLGVRRRRDKKGYPTPTARWFRGPLRAGLLERLTDGPAAHAGLLDPEGAKGLIARHARGEDHADALFRALSLDAWVGNVVVGMRLADIEAKHLSR